MYVQNFNNEIYNTSEFSEEMATIVQINKQQQELKKEIERDRKYKGIFMRLTFHHNTSNILENGHNIIRKLTERFEGDDSLEGVLFNNPQVKKSLSNIVNSQVKTIREEKTRCERRLLEITSKNQENDKEDDEEMGLETEIWEQYKINNLNLEKFESFILSNEGIGVIVSELKEHINPETWDFYSNYPISESILKNKLNDAWNDSLHREYNDKNGIYTDENKDNIDRIGNIVKDEIDKIVGDYMKNGGKVFNRELIDRLESMLSYSGDYESLDNLLKDPEYKDMFKELLKYKIINFSEELAFKGGKVSLNTSNTQVNLQLKSYLFMYGKFFHPEIFKIDQQSQYYEDILPKIMEAILSVDGDDRLKDLINNEFLENERKAEQERIKRDRLRLEIARRNREINEYRKAQSLNRSFRSIEINAKSIDPNNATGPEIAAKAGLGSELSDYNVDMKESKAEKQHEKEVAFGDAWNNFIQSNDNIDTFITKEQMQQLFDANNSAIREGDKYVNRDGEMSWEDFEGNNPLFKDMSQEEIKKIRDIIYSFPRYFNNAEKELSNNSSEVKRKINETVRTYAVGTVIDNVRDTFEAIPKGEDSNSEGFQLDNEKPVIKIDDYIIISGSFNGSNVKIRYDLKTGELCMNSFLHKDQIDPNKISIGDTSSIEHPELINYHIGEIKNFNNVLNDYYKFPPRVHINNAIYNGHKPGENASVGPSNYTKPPHNEVESGDNLPGTDTPPEIQKLQPRMDGNNTNFRKQEAKRILNSQIDLVDDAIEKHLKCQTLKNLAIVNFMNTFNVISDGKFNSLDFNRDSNLFSVIEIIDNTYKIDDNSNSENSGDGLQSLEYFNNEFMPKIIEYSGLKWGTKNEYQDKKNKKSKKIFSYERNNDDIKYLKDKVKDFDPKQFKDVANFNISHQLKFAELIKEKISEGKEPNWKLNLNMMKSFLKSIDTEEEGSSNKN